MNLQRQRKRFDGRQQALLQVTQYELSRRLRAFRRILQAFFPGLAVLIQKLRQQQFGLLRLQAIDRNLDDQPLGKPALNQAEVFLEGCTLPSQSRNGDA